MNSSTVGETLVVSPLKVNLLPKCSVRMPSASLVLLANLPGPWQKAQHFRFGCVPEENWLKSLQG